MVCNVIKCDRVGIYTQFDKPLSKNEVDTLREMARHRAKFEPLQYIIGSVNFYGLNIEVNKNVLIPRPETEILVDFACKKISELPEKIKILDIGTGSGCIALSLGRNFPLAEIHAIDCSEQAIDLAQRNAKNNSIENIKFYQCDILNEIPEANDFDVIVSNPPYVSDEEFESLQREIKLYEPKNSVSDFLDGYEFYRRFAEIFPKILKSGGIFFLEIGMGQNEIILNLFVQIAVELCSIIDFGEIPRIVTGKCF